MTLETRQLAYQDDDVRLNGFLAIDSTRTDKRPGVLVVHGGAGLDDHARGRARRFADAGFLAFACDMYGEAALAATVSVHGSLDTPRPAEPSAIQGKILVCHGALDPHVPMAQVTAFAEEMKHAGADYQVIIYGTAMHGFTHETATGQQAGVLYDETADRRSTAAIDGFLREAFAAWTTSAPRGRDPA